MTTLTIEQDKLDKMRALKVEKNNRVVMWKQLLMSFENVKINTIDFNDENLSRIYFRLQLHIYTKKGAFVNTTITFTKTILSENYSVLFGTEIKTKELKILASEMVDAILNNIEHIHPSLVLITAFSEIKYPDSYLAIEERHKKVVRRKGITKAEVLARKDDIISFYEKIKKEDLPERPIDEFNDERRSFKIAGPGTKHLINLLTELEIVEDNSSYGSSHTVYFQSKSYKSSYLAIMDAWETYLSSIFKPVSIYVHTWYCL
ncbi:hypothetical protein [Bacillus toyonensis]|uniref:hypothetical protein n=1 Tax=Bacillus toyonensis TaxID=155322 RepID=UPI002E213C42|nr:hypothetical protein [Bacillus toyonensis]